MNIEQTLEALDDAIKSQRACGLPEREAILQALRDTLPQLVADDLAATVKDSARCSDKSGFEFCACGRFFRCLKNAGGKCEL